MLKYLPTSGILAFRNSLNRHGWYGKQAASSNFSYRNSKLNLFGDYSFARNRLWNQMANTRQVGYQGVITQTDNYTERQPVIQNHTARLGFDYTLTSRTSLSGLASGFSDRRDMGDETSRTDIRQNQTLANSIQVLHNEINHWRHLMGNLSLHHAFNKRQAISLDLDRLLYRNHNPHRYFNTYTYQVDTGTNQMEEMLTMSKETPIRLWVGKADFTNSLGERTKVEVGAKGTQSNLNNDVLVRSQMEKIWRTLPEFSMEVHMTEDIGAGYVNMQHQFNSKTKLQAGLRYEYTHTHLTTPGESTLLQRRYGNWFPSAFLARDLRESSSIQVSYGRRITRPTFDVLAPFVYFFDPSTFFSGNLTLRPAISDALQATYRFHHRYLLSLGYTSEKDPIIPWQVHVDPATNQQNARAENLKSSDTYSLTFTFPVRVAAWWQMQTNLIGSWKNNRALYEGKVVQIEAGFGQVTHTQTFTLPHNFTAEVSAFYRTRSPFGLAYWRAFGAVNLGAKKKLKNDKGTISLTVNDLFWTSRFALLSYQPALNLNSSFIGYFSDPRIIRLTYSRTFGRSTGNALNKRSTGSEEERKRLNLN